MSSSGTPQQPGGQQQNPVLNAYQAWAERTPAVTRSTMVAVVGLYLFSWIWDLDRALGNVTDCTLFRFEVYRIIFSPIVGNSLLNTIVLGLFYPLMGSRMESSIGSSLYLWLLGFITVLTNVVFNLCCLLLYFANMPEALFYSCSGFWVPLFGLITIECMLTPEAPRQLMFIPVNIPSMYFPLVLYAFFALFSGPQLDFLLALGVGYLYSKGFFDRFRPSSTYLESLEAAGGVLHQISRVRGYVLAGGLGHDAWLPTNAAQVVRESGDSRGSYQPVQQQQQQQGSSGGWGGIAGFGSSSSSGGATAASGSGGEKVEAFPGSGHKLASSAPAPASKEAIAARRLEKLGGGSGQGP